MSVSYEVREDTSTLRRGAIPAQSVLLATALVPTSPSLDPTGTELLSRLNAFSDIYRQEADRILERIYQIAANPDLRDEGEPSPSHAVIEELGRLLRRAGDLMVSSMSHGQVSTFFGELNVTWRVGDKIVRLASFPNRPTILQTGRLSMPVGSYKSAANPSAGLLAEKLDSLAHDEDPEAPPFLG